LKATRLEVFLITLWLIRHTERMVASFPGPHIVFGCTKNTEGLVSWYCDVKGRKDLIERGHTEAQNSKKS